MRGEVWGKVMVGKRHRRDGEMGGVVGLGQKIETGGKNADNKDLLSAKNVTCLTSLSLHASQGIDAIDSIIRVGEIEA